MVQVCCLDPINIPVQVVSASHLLLVLVTPFTVSIITAAKTVVIIRLDQLDRDGGKLGKQIG